MPLTRFTGRGGRAALFLGASVALWTSDSSAITKQECAAASELAQRLRDEKRFVEAEAAAVQCGNPDCPEPVQKDCADLLERVRPRIPSVVVRARPETLLDVTVTVDGRPTADRLTGASFPLDPGPHTFLFETKGRPPVQRSLLIVEGEQNRVIEVEFGAPVPAPIPRATAGAPPVPAEDSRSDGAGAGPWILGGAGLLALGGFTYLGLSGKSDVRDMERNCAPNCAASDIDAAKTKLLVGDLLLGVGVVSLGLAGYWYLSAGGDKPAPPSAARSIPACDLTPIHGGAAFAAAWRF